MSHDSFYFSLSVSPLFSFFIALPLCVSSLIFQSLYLSLCPPFFISAFSLSPLLVLFFSFLSLCLPSSLSFFLLLVSHGSSIFLTLCFLSVISLSFRNQQPVKLFVPPLLSPHTHTLRLSDCNQTCYCWQFGGCRSSCNKGYRRRLIKISSGDADRLSCGARGRWRCFKMCVLPPASAAASPSASCLN